MKDKVYRKRRTIPIYGPPLNVSLLIAENIGDLIDKYCPEAERDDEDDKCRGMAILAWPNGYLIVKSKKNEIVASTLTHEIDHLVHKIMRTVGIKETDESEEAFCYLTSWLTDFAFLNLMRWKVSITA